MRVKLLIWGFALAYSSSGIGINAQFSRQVRKKIPTVEQGFQEKINNFPPDQKSIKSSDTTL